MSEKRPIEELVKEWLSMDEVQGFLMSFELKIIYFVQEEETRREIQALWNNNNITELESRLR